MTVVVSYIYGENYSELAELTVPILIKYCEKHKYACHIKQVKPNTDGSYDYIRIQEARKLIEDYNYVFMLEGDMMVTNMSVPVTDFIDEENHFFLCKDRNDYNGGSFIVKQSDWSRAWLNFVNSQQEKGKYKTEQNVFEFCCSFTSNVKTLDHPTINSIDYSLYAPSYGKIGYKEGEVVEIPTEAEGNWNRNHLLLHLPGKTLSERIEIFKKVKAEIYG